VTSTFDSLPRDLAAAHALILAERTARLESEEYAARAAADLIHAQATASSADALIGRLRLEIEKLRRTLYGARSERKERLIDSWRCSWETPRPTRPRTNWRRSARALLSSSGSMGVGPDQWGLSVALHPPAVRSRRRGHRCLARVAGIFADPASIPCRGRSTLAKIAADESACRV
jgi:hypothetical protein